jgi:hypothetical protein
VSDASDIARAKFAVDSRNVDQLCAEKSLWRTSFIYGDVCSRSADNCLGRFEHAGECENICTGTSKNKLGCDFGVEKLIEEFLREWRVLVVSVSKSMKTVCSSDSLKNGRVDTSSIVGGH